MSLTPLAERRLDVALATEQATGRLPSVVAGVVREGTLEWTGGISVLDSVTGPDVQYRIGSITKTLVAVLVMQLRDEGVLELSDPLSKHLSAVPYGERTLRELLSHSTGMAAEPAGAWWERSPGRSFDELVTALDDESPPFEPGATFHYSNVAFALLGEVAARHLQTTWWSAVHERILTPLAMTRTSYLPEEPHASGLSVHHYAGTLTLEPAFDAGAMAPAGQVWSTVGDLARYAAFLVAGHDEVLSLATLNEMTTPQSAARASAMTAAYGLGLQLSRSPSGMAFGHTGSMPGFLAGLFVDPVRRTGAVAMANATVGLRGEAFTLELLEILERTEGTMPRPWRPSADVPAPVEEILGVWHWGNTAHAFSWNGREVVATRLAGGVREHRFAPRADGTFLATAGYHHGEPLHVVRHDDGTVSHLECSTFIYTREPYDPQAPIPGR